jgi:hypothetical protein
VIRKLLSIPTRRERWALGILLAPVAIGIVFSSLGQSSKTTLFVEEPTPGGETTISASDGGGKSEIRARPRIISFRGAPLADARLTAPSRQVVEFLIPLGKEACARLRVPLDGSCRRGRGGIVPKTASPLSVVWPSVGDIAIRSKGLDSLSISRTPVAGADEPVTTWNLRTGAETTEVEFECIEESRFLLELGGVREELRCARASTLLRIPLLLSGSQDAAISLAGIERWHLLAHGQRADLTVNRGELFVGGDGFPLRGAKTPVTVSAEHQRGLELEVDDPSRSADTSIRVKTDEAASAEEGNESKLPSLLSEYKEYWFLFLGMIGGVLLSVVLERVPPRASIPARDKGRVDKDDRGPDTGPSTGNPHGRP